MITLAYVWLTESPPRMAIYDKKKDGFAIICACVLDVLIFSTLIGIFH